jgi:uncharacterized membrane protein YtjA (UPF0391 family)
MSQVTLWSRGTTLRSSVREKAIENTTTLSTEAIAMLYWALLFLVIALIAGIFGFGGIAAGAASIAQILFVVFLVLFVISLFFGGFRRGPTP